MSTTKKLLISALIFQLAILTGMLAKAALPYYTGTEIRLETQPRDPRSLFRGNYARLNYPISRIPAERLLEDFESDGLLREGEIIYTALKIDEQGLASADYASLNRPKSGLYLRGRLTRKVYSKTGTLNLKYGIEAFFAEKQEALRLERELADDAQAIVMVGSGGQARLKTIITKSAE